MNRPTHIEAHYNLRRQVIFSPPDEGAQLIADSEARAVASAVATLTCANHNDQQRSACPVCLVAALTAERDQLRAALADPQQLHAHCLRTLNEGQIAHLFGERVTEIVNRAERAEAELAELHASFAGNVHTRCNELRDELAAEREKVRMLRAALENLCDEQNGAPLETRRDQWQLAMDEARAAIVVTKAAK
jgi:DNA repair ATPase RecN